MPRKKPAAKATKATKASRPPSLDPAAQALLDSTYTATLTSIHALSEACREAVPAAWPGNFFEALAGANLSYFSNWALPGEAVLGYSTSLQNLWYAYMQQTAYEPAMRVLQ